MEPEDNGKKLFLDDSFTDPILLSRVFGGRRTLPWPLLVPRPSPPLAASSRRVGSENQEVHERDVDRSPPVLPAYVWVTVWVTVLLRRVKERRLVAMIVDFHHNIVPSALFSTPLSFSMFVDYITPSRLPASTRCLYLVRAMYSIKIVTSRGKAQC